MSNQNNGLKCFADKSVKGKGCKALKEKICLTRKCPFFKTSKQFNEDNERYPITNPKYLQ